MTKRTVDLLNFANRRFWLGIALTLILCGILIYFSAGTVQTTLANSRPEWAFAALGMLVASMVFRGIRLSLLSSSQSVSMRSWIHCAARHQILSVLMPSASGDLGFPYIAKKLCGLNFEDGTRIIALYRIQDLIALVALFAFGVAVHSGLWLPIAIASITIPIALFYSDRIVENVLPRVLLGLFRIPLISGLSISQRLSKLVEVQSNTRTAPSLSMRSGLVLCTILSWALESATFWCLFAMVGQQLNFGTVCLIVSALNLFGAINVLTIGGLGIGESALATILVGLEYSYEEAVAISLVVRPTALVLALSSCALIELVSTLLPAKSHWSDGGGTLRSAFHLGRSQRSPEAPHSGE